MLVLDENTKDQTYIEVLADMFDNGQRLIPLVKAVLVLSIVY